MRSVLFFLPVLFSLQTVHGQLYIGQGAQIRMTGNAQLTLNNISIINNGSFSPGTGTVSFSGNNTSVIGGTHTVVFNDVEINKTNSAAVVMQILINVAKTVRFTSGNLDLNGYIADLGSMGSLIGEKESSRIKGSNGGQVLFSTVLNNPVAANPANLGAVITSTQNLGTVLIRRGHKSQVNSYGIGNSILRYYDIVPMNPAPFSATLRINYFNGELNGLSENAIVFWNSSDNLHWTNHGFTSRNTSANYVEKTGISSFSRWTLSGINNPLPVKFSLFNLKCEGNKIVLTWKTALEQNSKHYNVEKSTDAASWVVIGSLPAAGNSNNERSYSFEDNNPVQNSYYRIAQYDIDGQVTYTNMLRSSCTGRDIFKVWPNPFTARIVINITAGNRSAATIKVFDSKGALVKTQVVILLPGVNQAGLSAADLPAGAYNLSVEWGEEQMYKTIQIIKQ